MADTNNVTTKNVTTGHPVAESVGAAGGAVTGMAVGAAVGGPVGAIVGGAVGAVAGGAAGHGVGAAIDPAVEDAYWGEHYRSRPYVKSGASYDQYRDAYRYGWESRAKTGSTWEASARDIERGWDKGKARSSMAWHDAKEAVRDGWDRIAKAMPGDADGNRA